MLDYKLTAKNNSLLNTPPVLAIHMCNLVLKDLVEKYANLKEIDEFSCRKSEMVYAAVGKSRVFYCPVAESFRSRMNAIFKSKTEKGEKQFLEKAEAKGLIQLKGHRSVGGLRASLYNAVTLENTRILCDLISEFE